MYFTGVKNAKSKEKGLKLTIFPKNAENTLVVICFYVTLPLANSLPKALIER